MIDTGDVRKGVTLDIDGRLVKVIDFSHNKQGRGSAQLRMTLRDLRTGSNTQMTVMAGTKFNLVRLERQHVQFLYVEGDHFHFMDTETYDQVSLGAMARPNHVEFVSNAKGSVVYASLARVELVLRLEVSEALPGGLAIYGARFGRYPVDPTVLFHAGGYHGYSANLITSFSLGVCPGSHGLAKAGMTAFDPQAQALDAFQHQGPLLAEEAVVRPLVRGDVRAHELDDADRVEVHVDDFVDLTHAACAKSLHDLILTVDRLVGVTPQEVGDRLPAVGAGHVRFVDFAFTADAVKGHLEDDILQTWACC